MYINYDPEIDDAIEKLSKVFFELNWDFSPDPSLDGSELISHWLGEPSEEIMVNVFKGNRIKEQFHRHDFFFIHFAYRGSYTTLSARYDDFITVNEGDCYIGQPYSGYAANKESGDECIIIAILIRRDVFVREFLGPLAADTAMMKFFLDPHKNKYSEEFIHMNIDDTSPIWKLLGLITLEYANKNEHTQKVMKTMVMSLVVYLSAEYTRQNMHSELKLEDRIIEYIEATLDTVSLNQTAAHFGYHPVYISRFLPEKTGKTFSQLVLEARMKRAKLLLNHTDLSNESIALMLGYTNSSNFYKAFKIYYGTTPRKL